MLRTTKPFKMKYLFLIILLSIVSCKNNVIENNYELDYNPNEEIWLVNKKLSSDGYDLISINGHILFYGHSKDFIIAIQKPSDSIYSYKEELRFPEMMDKIYKSNFVQFWILKIKNDSLYGPFKKNEYLKKRKEIGVPDNFKIDYSTLDFYGKDQRQDVQYKNPDVEVVDIENLKGNKS